MPNSPSSVAERPHWQFKPGKSGNPAGRPPNAMSMANLARKYGTKCVDRLAQFAGLVPGGEVADSHTAQIAAIKELLDRGYGKAVQHIEGDGADHWALHLLAAKAIAQELRAERQNPIAIEGTATDVDTNTDVSTFDISKPALE